MDRRMTGSTVIDDVLHEVTKTVAVTEWDCGIDKLMSQCGNQ